MEFAPLAFFVLLAVLTVLVVRRKLRTASTKAKQTLVVGVAWVAAVLAIWAFRGGDEDRFPQYLALALGAPPAVLLLRWAWSWASKPPSV